MHLVKPFEVAQSEVKMNIDDQVKNSVYHNDSVTFNYDLRDKATKAKLVKGSKRIPFEIENNSASSNLLFSVGAWLTSVLPAVRYWSEMEDKTCQVGDIEIRIGGIISGKDANGMHVVTQVVFFVERDKVICHFYNTTQKILVNGHGYKRLLEIFLIPFFQTKADASKDDIQRLNAEVLQKFGPKMVRRSSVKLKRKSPFPCKKCDFTCKSNSSLNHHKQNEHRLSFNVSQKQIGPTESTRNNSLVEGLLMENLSSTDLDKEEATLEEKVFEFNCMDCNYRSNKQSDMNEHTNNMHWVASTEKVVFVCIKCGTEFCEECELSLHVQSHESPVMYDGLDGVLVNKMFNNILDFFIDGEPIRTEISFDTPHHDHGQAEDVIAPCVRPLNPTYNCGKCKFSTKSVEELNSHMDVIHKLSDTQLKCRKCSLNFNNQEDLEKHMDEAHIICRVYSCNGCEYRTTVLTEYRNHMNTQHLKVQVNINQQNNEKDFITETSSKFENEEKQDLQSVVICGECGSAFEDIPICEKHINDQHRLMPPTEPETCDECGLVLANTIIMQEHKHKYHLNTSMESQTYGCKQCSFESDLYIDILRHTFQNHDVGKGPNKALSPTDIILEYLTVQTSDVMGEMKQAFEQLSNGLKIAFEQLSNGVQDNFDLLAANTSKRDASEHKNTKKTEDAEKKEDTVKTEDTEKNGATEKKNTRDSNKTDKRKKMKSKPRVTWIGTSISNVLDKNKFERDCNVELNVVKAYCIDKEENARYKDANFKTVVPETIKKKQTDSLILQTGSIEITDMNIEEGLKNSQEKIEAYKHEWFKKVEKDSTNLFNIAQDAIAQDSDIGKVVILKRLPRYDNMPKEIRKMRSDLSEYGNQVYDQLMLRTGHPSKIQIMELDLKCSDSQYLKYVIFGNPSEGQSDGVHLRGKGSSRHLTYRAVQALLPIIKNQRRVLANQGPAFTDNLSTNQEPLFSHERKQQSDSSRGAPRGYADAVNRGNNRTQTRENRTMNHNHETGFPIPTQNRFSSFYDNQGN